MAKYIIETKGNHVTRNQLMIALVQVLGLGEVISVENAAQQKDALDGAYASANCVDLHPCENPEMCGICNPPRE